MNERVDTASARRDEVPLEVGGDKLHVHKVACRAVVAVADSEAHDLFRRVRVAHPTVQDERKS